LQTNFQIFSKELAMSKWLFVALFAVVGIQAFGAEENPPKTEEKKDAKSENKFANPVPGKCPVMPEEEIDPNVTAEVDGKTYAFCCNKCARLFQAFPDKYLKKAPKKEEKKDEKKEDKKEEKK
jgi:YHS domain-containing protein